jgi:hypothetical protein
MYIIANEWYQFIRKSDWFEMGSEIFLWNIFIDWEAIDDSESNYEQVLLIISSENDTKYSSSMKIQNTIESDKTPQDPQKQPIWQDALPNQQ